MANAWRTIPTSMCGANSEIWRRWHYSVGVFSLEWSWPSRNTARKYKRRRVQGHSDPLSTVYGIKTSSVMTIVCIGMTMLPAINQGLWTIRLQQWTGQPSLNPIEHPWDELERRLRCRPQRPTSLTALATALQEEWAAIPPETFSHLVGSLPGTVQAVIKPKDGPNRY
jgi:hypothetical protein